MNIMDAKHQGLLKHLFVDDAHNHIAHNFLFMFGIDVEIKSNT
jgi:hypothetical protein